MDIVEGYGMLSYVCLVLSEVSEQAQIALEAPIPIPCRCAPIEERIIRDRHWTVAGGFHTPSTS